jgi:hypothetical protein
MSSRRTGSASAAGSGTHPSTGTTISGDVPQVTCGASVAASSATSRSKTASASLCNSPQACTARSHSAPAGARGRPRRYSRVRSSTATSPARAPASMAMLHSVMRPSTESARTAAPANSTVWPVAPAVPIAPMSASARSLAVTPGAHAPSMRTRKLRDFFSTRHWVASTCSTSEVPIPKASAPTAPWVEVCESPHTTVMPGRVRPCSGPTTWTMPWRGSHISNSVIPKAAQLASSASTCTRETGSAMPCARAVVGTLWSGTASAAPGRHGRRPASRSPSKACGEVTSWTRWRSM